MDYSSDVIGAFFVEDHGVLHPGAAALFHIDAEGFAIVFRLREEGFYFFGGAGSKLDDWSINEFRLHILTYKD